MADIIVLHTGSLVTRRDARDAKLKRYFTGKPCSKGHVAQRLTSTTACVECNRVNMARWRAIWPKVLTEDEKKQRREKWADNKDAINEKRRQDRAEDPEKYRASKRRWYQENKELVKEREKKRLENIGKGVVNARYKAGRDRRLARIAGRPRPSVCDECKERHRIVFDHCHETGRFRGWLCDRCNKVLGLVKDDPSLLRSLAKYLERTSGTTDNKEEEPTPLFRLCGT